MTNQHCSDEQKEELLVAIDSLGIKRAQFIRKFLSESRDRRSLKGFDTYKRALQPSRPLSLYDHMLMSEFLEVLYRNQLDRVYMAASPFLRELDLEARDKAALLCRKVGRIAKKREPR
jgi:hypothetical protein